MAHTVSLEKVGGFPEEGTTELNVIREEKVYRQPRLRGQPCEGKECVGRKQKGALCGLESHRKSLDLALQCVGCMAGFLGAGVSRENLSTVCRGWPARGRIAQTQEKGSHEERILSLSSFF